MSSLAPAGPQSCYEAAGRFLVGSGVEPRHRRSRWGTSPAWPEGAGEIIDTGGEVVTSA